MTTQEGTTVEASELVTNGASGKAGEGILETMESDAGPIVKPEAEAEPVKDSAVAVESNNSSVKLESANPVDVKVDAVKEIREERNGSESKVVANGHSGSKREENGEDLALSLESDGVTILPHWHAKPCVHITGLGGVVTEEDLVPLLTPHGRIVSIVFENDRRDSAIVRYEPSDAEGEDVVARVRETVNNKEIKDKTLVVEPFRPDSLLFIGNLTPEIDDSVLRQMFEPHGTVERAFVLRNVGGRSKGYGFVEYSLKSQASAAKVAMGNINMDGRVLRVEWSDCRKISDMFSTVLFVDRISKDSTHIEQALRNSFGQFGRVRDCHLAIGMNQQLRGFAFIDYYHSTFADKAHEALDGREVEGSNIRVSFANPSKSAQSYKSRFGTQGAAQVVSNHGRGAFPEHVIRPVGPVVGAAIRGHAGMPVLGNRFLGHGRTNMLGMSIGMQFGRGAPVGPGMIGRNLVPPLIASGAGMLGPGSVGAGMMGRSPGMLLGHNGQRGVVTGGYGQQGSRLLIGRGPVPISSAAIAQVATAQAKVREEEAKARAEAQAKQSQSGAKQSAAEQERLEQFRKMAAQQAQLMPQHSYYQQHPQSSGLDQQYKQGGSQYAYQQPYQQSAQLQSALHTQYQHQPTVQPAVQQATASQQSQQSYSSQYYPQSTEQYTQQAQPQQQQQQQQPQSQPQPQHQHQQSTEVYNQQQAYYQQPSQPSSQAGVSTQQQYSQYAHQYGQQYAQQYGAQQQQQPHDVQQYGQRPTAQQYTESTQLQAPAQYTQQDYANYYTQQHQPPSQQTQTPTIAVVATTAGATTAQTADVSQQQQAYAAYYQQRAQEAVAQAGTPTVQTMTSSTGSPASLEAQWAAYYAAQAAHQQATATATTGYEQQTSYAQQQPYAGTAAYYQQPAAVDVGQKRTADQIDYSTQVQASYGYQQQASTVPAGFTQQQAVNGTTAYQQQPAAASSAYQQPASALPSYQQPATAYQQQSPSAVPSYPQQTSATSGYAQTVAGGYQQVAAPSPSGYQQPVASVVTGYQQPSAAVVSAYSQPNQSAVPAPVYDYSKRPRY